MSPSRTETLKDLSRSYRIFGALGWGDLGDGHISARDPECKECFWLLRDGIPFTHTTEDDLVLLDRSGNTVLGEGTVNAPAFNIHCPILTARADLNSAAHTHTPWGTPFSAEVRPILPITQEACIFQNDCAIFDDEEVQIRELEGGTRIAQCLGPKHAIILRNHGLLTVGASIASAVVRFVTLERVAEAHLKTQNPVPISIASARYAHQGLFRESRVRAKFEYLAKFHGID